MGEGGGTDLAGIDPTHADHVASIIDNQRHRSLNYRAPPPSTMPSRSSIAGTGPRQDFGVRRPRDLDQLPRRPLGERRTKSVPSLIA